MNGFIFFAGAVGFFFGVVLTTAVYMWEMNSGDTLDNEPWKKP